MRVPIQAQLTCVAESRTLRGVTRNISETGIGVELPELRKRANVRLEFRLPGSDSMIDATGAVIWVSGKRNGIKFKYVGEPVRSRSGSSSKSESIQPVRRILASSFRCQDHSFETIARNCEFELTTEQAVFRFQLTLVLFCVRQSYSLYLLVPLEQ